MNEIVKKETGTEVATAERTRTGTTYTPRFDIVETEDELVLYGDLPGVSPDNLDVRFESLAIEDSQGSHLADTNHSPE